MARPETSTADLAVLLHSSSVVVLSVGEHLSVPGARPADNALPKEDYASVETVSLVY